MNSFFRKTMMMLFFVLIIPVIQTNICTADDPIRFGVAVVKTGELASYGISGLRGVELAVKKINSRGGLLRRQIQILSEDDLCLPKNALLVASRLVQQNVHAVIGHICSGATFAALDTYKNQNLITISPSATNPELTKSGNYPNFFRTISPDDQQAKLQAEFVTSTLKVSKIAIIHDRGVYGKGLSEYVKIELEKINDVEIVLFEGISTGSINYIQFVQKIQRSEAEAVIYGGYHPGASKLVRQMRLKKMNTLFISGDGVKDRSYILSAGKHAEGSYATAPMDKSGIKMANEAVRDYRYEYKSEPGPFFLNAYAATLALANAIEIAGSLNYDDVSLALKSNYVNTPLGNISFDKNGDATGTGFSVYKVENGIFTELSQ